MQDLVSIGIRSFILDKESDVNREKSIKIPCIARHFKHELTNDYPMYFYVVTGIAEVKNLRNIDEKLIDSYLWAKDANNHEKVYPIYKINGQFYINTYEDGLQESNYVIYKALYSNETFIREFNEFMSPVDKEKYPNIRQYWRFELY